MSYQWDFSGVWEHKDMLLTGLLGTVKLAAISICLGIVVGLLVALMKMSSRRGLNIPANIFIEFFRNTPPIVHFFWFFYALPMFAGINLSPYWAATIALSTQSGAFYAEVFRGGILSIDKGQWEGAKAIGMTYRKALIRIILPQAARRMVGPFVERTFELTKTTTLASTLAYADLLYQAMQVNSITYRPLETYSTIAVMYFLTLLTLSMLIKLAERKMVIH
ncbi:amino acid ABC transporter permease [Pokkaliibacter sp. CJK22405]|uniref:amino acid ABC transporter permease n=1 Tax=Pokkaliibacter sp. CJK22405 TaxID=3384615 RepID=UPI003984875B